MSYNDILDYVKWENNNEDLVLEIQENTKPFPHFRKERKGWQNRNQNAMGDKRHIYGILWDIKEQHTSRPCYLCKEKWFVRTGRVEDTETIGE